MKLTSDEKMLVNELRRDPRFGSILHKAVTDAENSVPSYKPPTNAAEDAARVGSWKYRSGWAAGVDFLAKMLGYENERRKDR